MFLESPSGEAPPLDRYLENGCQAPPAGQDFAPGVWTLLPGCALSAPDGVSPWAVLGCRVRHSSCTIPLRHVEMLTLRSADLSPEGGALPLGTSPQPFWGESRPWRPTSVLRRPLLSALVRGLFLGRWPESWGGWGAPGRPMQPCEGELALRGVSYLRRWAPLPCGLYLSPCGTAPPSARVGLLPPNPVGFHRWGWGDASLGLLWSSDWGATFLVFCSPRGDS